MQSLLDAETMIFHWVLSEKQIFYFLSSSARAIKETRILVWRLAAAGSRNWGGGCVKNDPLTYIIRFIFCGNFFTFVRVMDFKSQG